MRAEILKPELLMMSTLHEGKGEWGDKRLPVRQTIQCQRLVTETVISIVRSEAPHKHHINGLHVVTALIPPGPPQYPVALGNSVAPARRLVTR